MKKEAHVSILEIHKKGTISDHITQGGLKFGEKREVD